MPTLPPATSLATTPATANAIRTAVPAAGIAARLPRPLLAVAVLVLAAAGLSAVAPVRAQPVAALPAGITEATRVEGITEYRLANGLQLLLVPDNSKPSATVNLTLRVGSRHENYGETGMAHLLEHLIFKGTPTTRNVWGEFTKRGLRANGSTWLDRTNYFASFTENEANLRWYIGWLADALVNSLIAKEDLASEMTVVRNEMEMGENNPGQVLYQRTLAAMYDWHNYGKDTIGARSDVENVDISRLQAFYRRYYQPDNATVIVAGRFDSARVLGYVAESFGRIAKPARTLAPTYTLDPAQDGERVVTVRRVGGTPVIYMAHHAPAGAHADFAAISLLTQVLGDTPGGRLHKRLVDTRLAAGSFGFALALAEPSPFIVGAQLGPGQDVDRVRAEMARVLDAAAGPEPITAEELERARTQWLNGWEKGFSDPEVIGVQISEAIALGDWRLYFLGRDQVKRATLADVQRVARERLRSDNRTVAIYRPVAEPQRAPAPARVDVAALVKDYKGDPNVALAEAFDATPANLDRRSQVSSLGSDKQGMKVALLPKGTRGRAVHAQLMLRYGDESSLAGRKPLDTFVASMFAKGGAGLTRQQIADRFDQLRAEVGWEAGEQGLVVTLRTVREHLPACIELIGKLLRQPAFAEPPLEEARRQWLAAIETDRKEPESVIANALARLANPYPPADWRYAPSFDELEARVKGVTLAQLVDFHRRFYSAQRAEFAAVGDMDAAAVTRALEAAFGDWRQPAAGALAYKRVPRPLVPVKPERLVLPTPDKQNANLLAHLPLPLTDTHADHVPFMLANWIVGQGGTSRLWMRIREKEGLSYDVRSGVQWNPFEPNSRWTSSAIFAPQNQGKVEAAWREELQRATREGFTPAELEEAKSALLNFRRLSRAQDDVVAAQAANNQHLARTFAFAQQIDERIAAATLADVNAAWRRHFDLARVAVGWGGDFGAKAPQ
ncbi:MAG: insulinase family protein [Burkholderiales bacterium]|nr:insulinase family protein [Burkholderiales bacterium]